MPILAKGPRLLIEETEEELRIVGTRVLLEQASLVPDEEPLCERLSGRPC